MRRCKRFDRGCGYALLLTHWRASWILRGCIFKRTEWPQTELSYDLYKYCFFFFVISSTYMMFIGTTSAVNPGPRASVKQLLGGFYQSSPLMLRWNIKFEVVSANLSDWVVGVCTMRDVCHCMKAVCVRRQKSVHVVLYLLKQLLDWCQNGSWRTARVTTLDLTLNHFFAFCAVSCWNIFDHVLWEFIGREPVNRWNGVPGANR